MQAKDAGWLLAPDPESDLRSYPRPSTPFYRSQIDHGNNPVVKGRPGVCHNPPNTVPGQFPGQLRFQCTLLPSQLQGPSTQDASLCHHNVVEHAKGRNRTSIVDVEEEPLSLPVGP